MKRRFRFRLERVLDERRRTERLMQRELAVLLDSLAATRRQREAALMRAAELRDIEGQWLANPSCPVHELRILRGEIEALAAATAELGRQCVWFEDAVTRQRQRLIEAARARRLLERLRERALDEFMIEMRRIEAAVLDDVRRREPALEWGT